MYPYLIAAFLVLHGLIHAIGLATTFGNAEIEGFSGAPTLDVGAALPAFSLLWGVALAGMLAAAVGVALGQAWWRPVALVAAVVSTIAVTVWWQDARFGAVANALVVIAVVAASRIPDVAHLTCV